MNQTGLMRRPTTIDDLHNRETAARRFMLILLGAIIVGAVITAAVILVVTLGKDYAS